MAALAFYLFSVLLLGGGTGVIFSRNPVHSVLFLIFSFFNAAALFILLGAEFLAMLLVIVYVGAVAVLFLFVVMMLDVKPEEKRRIPFRSRLQASLISFFELGKIFTVFAIFSLSGIFLLYAAQQTWPALLQSLWTQYTLLGVILFLSYAFSRKIYSKSLLAAAVDFLSTLPLAAFLGMVLLIEMVFLAFGWHHLAFSETYVQAPIPPEDLIPNTQALGKILYTEYVYLFQGAGLILLIAMIGAIVLTHRKREGVKRQNISDQLARRKEETITLVKAPIGRGIE